MLPRLSPLLLLFFLLVYFRWGKSTRQTEGIWWAIIHCIYPTPILLPKKTLEILEQDLILNRGSHIQLSKVYWAPSICQASICHGNVHTKVNTTPTPSMLLVCWGLCLCSGSSLSHQPFFVPPRLQLTECHRKLNIIPLNSFLTF